MKNNLFWLVLLSILAYFISKYIIKSVSNKKISATDMMSKKNFTEEDAKKAILEVKKIYGENMAKTIERMMRLETAHFKSGQYKLTGSAGMEVGKWKDIPAGATEGYIEIDDKNKAGMEKFIVWKTVTDFAKYLAEYILRYKGNYARWNSLDQTAQAEYLKRVDSITNKFV